jgi:tetratricopeptide (TPR) repeat protein
MSVPTVQPARISGLPPAPGPGVPASELDAAVRRPATFSIAPPAPGEKAAARPSRTPSLPPMPLAVETSGSLGVRSPAKLALELKAARCSGVLVMRKEKVEKRIWFAAGTPVQIESTSPEEDLGALMKKRGKLDDDVFAAYQALRREGRSAVDALVEIGAVQAADAPKADRWRAQGVLYDALLWRDGTYEFQPAAELPATVPRYDMALPVLMVKAWREAPFDDSRKKFLDAHRNWYVVPGAISDDTAAKMRLNPKEERLLDAVKGQARRIRDIFEMSSLLLTDTYRFIDGLLAMGMAELSERNPMETGPVDVKELRGLLETMEAQNLFDRLSAHPVSTDQDIEDAWKRARSLYEPSRYRNLRPETKATLERILKLSSEAYEHLKDGKRRKSYRFQQYDRQRLDYFAEIQFRKGEIYLFWRDDPKTAFEMFESSWEMCPDNPLYVVSYALSAMRAYPGEARRRAEAKGLIERALSRVDVPPKVMVIAAAVYRLLGEMPRSEQLCRAALQASGGATDIVQMVEQVRKQ